MDKAAARCNGRLLVVTKGIAMGRIKVLKPVAGVVILVGLYAAAGYIGVPAGVRWAVSNVVPML